MAAYRGKDGCDDSRCTQNVNKAPGDPCFGWHCSYCDGRSNSMGHCDCEGSKKADEEFAEMVRQLKAEGLLGQLREMEN